MKILVTGAGGMVGGDLCPTLQARGHEVIRTDLHPGASTELSLRDSSSTARAEIGKSAQRGGAPGKPGGAGDGCGRGSSFLNTIPRPPFDRLRVPRRGVEGVPSKVEGGAGCCMSHQLDVRQREAIATILKQTDPELVIHLAAETDVDRCELEPAHAYETNAVGTEYVASCCQQAGVRVLYVSTAGVFDGTKATPYVESDAPNPVNVYGRAKLAGEFAVRQLPGFRIVRAGWMVGGCEHDKKFAGKILRLLEHRRHLSVVTDKIGSPTFTKDLSAGIAALLETDATGVFHMTNRGVCSRYEFACQMLKTLGLEGVTITPIGSEAFPLPAPRAASEAMASERLASLGLQMPAWQESLQAYLHQFRFAKLIGAETPGP